MTRTRAGRRGATLIELLVVMSIITALGLLALMLMPGINNSDGALKGTEVVRSTAKVSQALASGSRQPRGFRCLVPTGGTVATELQLLESPPVTVLDPQALVLRGTTFNAVPNINSLPYVQFEYTLGTAAPNTGAIVSRRCLIYHLTPEQSNQVGVGALLFLPALGSWSRIDAVAPPLPASVVGLVDLEVVLNVYPDTFMGASTHYRTYHAGIYGAPIPLLGQPTIPMPKDIAIDLAVSVPPITALTAGANYDIMFAPDGQTISVGGQANNAGVYLWVRDISKNVNLNVPAGPALSDAFRRGGEQHAVGIANGFVGTAPIQWPDAATNNYPAGGPFLFARRKLN